MTVTVVNNTEHLYFSIPYFTKRTMHKFHRLKRRTADDVHSEDEDDADLDQKELPSDDDDIDDDASSVSEESASEESEEDEDAHHTDYRFVEQNKIKLADIGDEAVEVLDFKDIGPQWKDAKKNTAMTTEQFPSLPWLNPEMKSDEGEEDGDLGENESSIASDVNESKDIFPYKSADSTSRASKEDATPNRSSYPQQRRSNQLNPYQKRFQERREYHKKLAEDPSFVPHLGEFWGHDDRFREEGLRNVELSGVADRWGARGGYTRGRVAGGVGMHGGYAHVRGTWPRIAGRGGRGGRDGTTNLPFTDGIGRGRTPMGPGLDATGADGSASGAGVGAVAVAVAVAGPGGVASQATSIQEKWQHDGFEELMRMEEVEDRLRRERLEKREKLERLRLTKQEDRERAQARFVGRGGYGRGGFRGRGRGVAPASVRPRAIDRGFLPQNLVINDSSAPPSRANAKAEAETSLDEQKSEGQSTEAKVEHAPSTTPKRQNHNRGEVQGISRMLSKALPRTDPASFTGSTASGELEPVRGRHNMNGRITTTTMPATSSTIASTSATTKIGGFSSQKGSTTSVTAEEGGYWGIVPDELVEGERASKSLNGRASRKDIGNARPVDKQQAGYDGEEEDEEEDSDVEIILVPEVAGEHPEQVLGIVNPTPQLWPAQSEGGDHIDTNAELGSKQGVQSRPSNNGSILRASAKEWKSTSIIRSEEKDDELLVATTANGENSKSGKRIPDVNIPQKVPILTQEVHMNPAPGNKGKDKPVKNQLPHTPGKVEVPMSPQGWVAHPNGHASGTVIGATSHLPGMMYPPDAMIMGQPSLLMGMGMGYLPHNGYPAAVPGFHPSPLFVPPARPAIENRRPLVIRAPPTTSAPVTSSSSGAQSIAPTLPISAVYAMPFQPATTEPLPGPVYYPTPQASNSQQQPQQPSVMSPSVSNSAITNPAALEGKPPTTTYEVNGMVYYNPYESLPPPVYYYYPANAVPGFDTTSAASMGGSYVPMASGSGNNVALSQEGMNGWGMGEEMSWSEGENNWGAEQQSVVEDQGRPSSGIGVIPTSGAGSTNMYYYYPMYY